jgi:hypothetical protein
MLPLEIKKEIEENINIISLEWYISKENNDEIFSNIYLNVFEIKLNTIIDLSKIKWNIDSESILYIANLWAELEKIDLKLGIYITDKNSFSYRKIELLWLNSVIKVSDSKEELTKYLNP